MPRPNKIESELTGPQLAEFIDRLYNSKDHTLRAIQELAGEYGIAVSHEGARTFKKNNFESHLERLKRYQDKIAQAAAISRSGAAADMNEVTAGLIAGEFYDHINAVLDDDGKLDFGEYSKVITRLRLGDQRQATLEARLKESEAKVREYEAKEAERAAKKKEFLKTLKSANRKAGERAIDEETMSELEEALNLA